MEWVYVPMTPDQMAAAVVANLPVKTGRRLEAWAKIVRSQGPQRFMERVKWLKAEHGLGHVQAQMVAWEADRGLAAALARDPSDLVDAQYAGAKAALRPIHDRLVEAAQALGQDVRVEARQTYVSLARTRQFAVVAASTLTRLDLGLRLADAPAGSRLLPAGSFGSGNTTHKVALTTLTDVDADVLDWLRAAYEQAR